MKYLNFTFFFFIVFYWNPSFAQIYKTESNIIEELGAPDETGVTDDGKEYIVYKKELETKASGEYTRHKVMYFAKLEDGTEICDMWKIFEPSTETNSFVSYFKDTFVEVDYMQWKDYETEILYDVEVEDKICIVTAVFDNSK